MTFTRRSFLKSTALGLGVVAMPLTIHAKAAPADDFRQFMDGFSKAELDEIFPHIPYGSGNETSLFRSYFRAFHDPTPDSFPKLFIARNVDGPTSTTSTSTTATANVLTKTKTHTKTKTKTKSGDGFNFNVLAVEEVKYTRRLTDNFHVIEASLDKILGFDSGSYISSDPDHALLREPARYGNELRGELDELLKHQADRDNGTEEAKARIESAQQQVDDIISPFFDSFGNQA